MFGDAGCLSLGVSLGAISQQLVDEWELSPPRHQIMALMILFSLLKYCQSQEQGHIIVL